MAGIEREGNPTHEYQYNQGTEGKGFQGQEGKAFRVERERDLGLGWDLTRYRGYDYQLGRFWQVDPKADVAGQEGLAPYQYSFNNPVRYNDPMGDLPPQLIGAIVGAVTELGTQVVSNVLSGKKWNDIDYGDVGVAAAEGALTSGGSALKAGAKIALMVGTEVVKAAVDVKKEGVEVVGGTAVGLGEKPLKSAAIDLTVGATGKLGGEALTKNATGTLEAAKAPLALAEKSLARKVPGSNNYIRQQTKVNGIKQEVNNAEANVEITKNVYNNALSAGGSVTGEALKDENKIVNKLKD